MKEKIKRTLLKRLVKKIEQDNEIFNNSIDGQKRVIIAQDCIERIRLNQIIADSGVFVQDTRFNECNINESFQKILNSSDISSAVQCEACAKGGLFLSYVGRVNQFDLKDLIYGNDVQDAQHIKLLEIFEIEQLAMIEAAFEGIQMIGEGYSDKHIDLSEFSDDDSESSFSKYVNKYPDEKKRLVAICENIIANEGTFVY